MNSIILFTVVAAATMTSSAEFYGSFYRGLGGVLPVHKKYDSGVLVDFSLGYSDYHFSWRHDGGQEYDWRYANKYCAKLGPGWYGIDIESIEEDQCIDNIIAEDNVKYIWTGGSLSGYGWSWSSGAPFYELDWSYTGGLGKPQPDNREGNEYCLAVLNNFYNDGITWHDVACHHRKPIICERKRTFG